MPNHFAGIPEATAYLSPPPSEASTESSEEVEDSASEEGSVYPSADINPVDVRSFEKPASVPQTPSLGLVPRLVERNLGQLVDFFTPPSTPDYARLLESDNARRYGEMEETREEAVEDVEISKTVSRIRMSMFKARWVPSPRVSGVYSPRDEHLTAEDARVDGVSVPWTSVDYQLNPPLQS